MIQAINTERGRIATSVDRALETEAQAILEDSKENYVPVLTGKLKRSGEVTNVGHNIDGDALVVITYNTPYATLVHERAEPYGGRKYLEQPVRNAASGMSARVGAVVKSQ